MRAVIYVLSIVVAFTIVFCSMTFALDISDFTFETKVTVFSGNDIHFNQEEPSKFASDSVLSLDNGREIYRDIELPSFDKQTRITAHLEIHPLPKDDLNMHDNWDRAGNIRLAKEGMEDIEIVKFITAYGGESVYDVDVSHLAKVLQGKCKIIGFIDTWASPGWKVDFSLTYETVDDSTGDEVYIDYIYNPQWVQGLIFEPSYNLEKNGETGIEVEIEIPEGLNRVVLNYFVSGHCTDGNGADEFVPKDNVIYVDGEPVFRFQPWRDDCTQFRSNNPYTRRWSSGYWSSDYSRSGWCPGDKVDPVQVDLTDYLKPGKHVIRFHIENVRPKDEKGNMGYWRISGHLLGWNKKANLVAW
ncbi:MAG: hypothetical protein KAR42_12440 [candidate division Zixibacteria bacterium]|nr:hypothetical protein [candidate division Zixibacteria bacterium]